jgi:glycine/sarcosine N-methyltransferase
MPPRARAGRPDKDEYTLDHLIVSETPTGWQTSTRRARYRALRRDELSALLIQAGFTEPLWLMPDETGYYQPIIRATCG